MLRTTRINALAGLILCAGVTLWGTGCALLASLGLQPLGADASDSGGDRTAPTGDTPG